MESNPIETSSKSKVKPNLNIAQKIRFACSNITVEPLLVCFVVPIIMSNLTTQNLNLEKACRVNLRLNDSICDSLAARNSSGYDRADEVEVQRVVASAYIWKGVVQSFFPIIMLPLLGSWCDRYKRRKLCILLPLLGEVLTSVGLLFCTFFFYQMSLELTVLTEVLAMSLTCGWNAMFMGVYTYVGAVASTETKTIRFGIIHIAFNFSLTVGNALSGVVHKVLGYYGVYILALVVYLSGLLYGIFGVKEDRTGCEKRNSKIGFFEDFFNLRRIVENYKVLFRKDKENKIKKIFMFQIISILLVGQIHGELNVVYLYTRYKFQWNEINFSIFFTYSCVFHLLGCAFALAFFSKFLKLDDAWLGIIASGSRVFGCLIYAFAPNTTVFYVGTLVEVFSNCSFIAVKSISAKLVSENELGKMNSLMGIFEAITPLVFGPLYSGLYKATINDFPGSFYLLDSLLNVPMVIIFIWLYLHPATTDENSRENDQNEELSVQDRLLNR